jgi:hypothetical protein
MINPIMSSFFALLGVVIGAALQFLFSRYVSREGKYLEKRFGAYLSFMRSLSSEDLDSRMGAHLELVTYAHDRVLKPFLEFEKLGGLIKTEEQKRAFVRVIRAIRSDAGGRAHYTDEDLFLLTMLSTWEGWNQPSN